jgi:thiamine biosynthesis protein ThiS
LIGRSIHSAEAAAANADADYLIAGHVFRSRSKPGLLPLGLDGLAAIVAAATVPVLAIGGISVSNVEGVLQTGAFGVAVIDAIASATDPRAAASTLRQVIDQVDAKEQTMSTAAEETIVTVNGKDVAVPSGASVADFLMSKGFREKLVVVELNGRILDRGRFASTPLAAGDKVEIVHFVGGG